MDRRTPAVLGVVGVLGGVVGLVGWGSDWGNGGSSASHICDVESVATDALPSVVTVAVHTQSGGGTGSGVVVRLGSGSPVIATNAHVVAVPGRGKPQVQVTYADGHTSSARIDGVDKTTDLAVLSPSDSDNAPAIAIGDSGALRVGNPVVALGAPLGLSSTVTSGIVSATGRYVRVPGSNGVAHHLIGAVQTDAAINPGNSGGALVDCDAQLVGINAAGASPAGDGGSSGLGFAIPIALAKPLLQELATHGRVSHPTLGLLLAEVPRAMQASAGGSVTVQAVESGGPAAVAGIRAGDVIVDVDGQAVHEPEDLTQIELGATVGAHVPVTVVRNGSKQTLQLTVASS